MVKSLITFTSFSHNNKLKFRNSFNISETVKEVDEMEVGTNIILFREIVYIIVATCAPIVKSSAVTLDGFSIGGSSVIGVISA